MAAVTCLLVGATVLSAWAVVVNFGQDTVIDRLSACERDPTGAPCQQVKRQSDKAQPLTAACIQLRKAGYPCPKPGSGAARRLNVSQMGGDAQNPSKAGQQPAPGNGGNGVGQGRGGGNPPHPPGPIAPGPSSPGQSNPPPQTGTAPVDPGRTGQGVVEGVTGVVEGVTGTVEDAVCPAQVAGVSACD